MSSASKTWSSCRDRTDIARGPSIIAYRRRSLSSELASPQHVLRILLDNLARILRRRYLHPEPNGAKRDMAALTILLDIDHVLSSKR